MQGKVIKGFIKKYLERNGYILSRPGKAALEEEQKMVRRLIDWHVSYIPVNDHRRTTAMLNEKGKEIDVSINIEGLENILDVDSLIGKRILEVGPKYGVHSRWIDQRLRPSELVLIDIAKQKDFAQKFDRELTCPHKWIYGNILTSKELLSEEPFDFIFFLGVLYHNVEHVKMLNILNRIAKPGGSMLLESTFFDYPQPVIKLRHKFVEELHVLGSQKAKAYPTLDALKMMLAWTGWGKAVHYAGYRPDSTEKVILCYKTANPLYQYTGIPVGGSE